MRFGILWLIGLFLFVKNKRGRGIEEYEKIYAPTSNKPQDKYDLLKKTIILWLAELGFYVAKAILRMKVIDVPGEYVAGKKPPSEETTLVSNYTDVNSEFKKETVFKNFYPREGRHCRYKLVSFPVPVGMFITLIVGFVRWWNIATFDEFKMIESSNDFRKMGLGESFHILFLGTIIRHKSSMIAISSPMVFFSKNQATSKEEKRLSMCDILFGSVMPGCYILFRTK